MTSKQERQQLVENIWSFISQSHPSSIHNDGTTVRRTMDHGTIPVFDDNMTLNQNILLWLAKVTAPVFPTSEMNFEGQSREINMIDFSRPAAGTV